MLKIRENLMKVKNALQMILSNKMLVYKVYKVYQVYH